MDNKGLPLIDVSDLDPVKLKEFFDNEKIIQKLFRIPKKKKSKGGLGKLLNCVRKRSLILRNLNN